MKYKYLSLIYILTFFCIVSLSCNSVNDFMPNDKVSKNDSLFLGLYLGMPQQEFFDHCTELNKQELITQASSGSTSVEYRIKNDYEKEVSMRFFPTFIDYQIYEMPVLYSYVPWAPWNKQYQSDVLLEHVYERYKKIYGDDFKTIEHPHQGKVYYKIDGKRRINLFIKDDQYVQAVFTDLKVEKRLHDEYEKSVKSPEFKADPEKN